MLTHSTVPSEISGNCSIRRVPSLRWSELQGVTGGPEEIIEEAALCLEVAYSRSASLVIKTLGITMRTPGCDEELALGFLLGEGVITGASDVQSTEALAQNHAGEKIETRRVYLSRPPQNNLQRVSRATTTTSACGLCGRGTLEGLPLHAFHPAVAQEGPFSGKLITALPEVLRLHQTAFAKTGGCHGAGLSNQGKDMVLTREDVGRHNAVDKVLGAALQQNLALGDFILVLSGRASFELVQKSASAGIPVVVAVGAPSSAAVELAHAAEITLIGFTRENRFNIYTHAVRISLE